MKFGDAMSNVDVVLHNHQELRLFLLPVFYLDFWLHYMEGGGGGQR